MELLHQLPAFLLAVLIIAAVPGPAIALIVRRCTVGGFRAGIPVVLGLEAGLYFWILAAGAGLAALVATSEVAYTALRVVGAGVLLVLGVQALRATRRGAGGEVSVPNVLPRNGFGIGLLTNAANPKAAVFTFAFYPQFVPKSYPMLPTAAALGLLHVGVELGLYLGFAAAVGRARSWFGHARIRRRLDALAGGVLVLLGVRVAAER
jgi:threonine/homoserine/homoserine lactone efflux protein